MFTKDQLAKFRRSLATVEENQPKLDMLAQMAQLNPALADRVNDLNARAEYVRRMAQLALQLGADAPG